MIDRLKTCLDGSCIERSTVQDLVNKAYMSSLQIFILPKENQINYMLNVF